MVLEATWKQGATAATAEYLFADIQANLDWCWARGLKLMIMIQDKTFVMENPLPQYLAHKAIPNRVERLHRTALGSVGCIAHVATDERNRLALQVAQCV